MYKVSYIYAVKPSVYFKTEKEARAFQSSKVAATKLEKRTFFGSWKKID